MTTSTTTRSASSLCSNCRNWSGTSNAAEGECRAHAPQAFVFTIDDETKFESRFPTTQASDWCGEFQPA